MAEKSHLDHHELLFHQWGIEAPGNWHLFTQDQRDHINRKYKGNFSFGLLEENSNRKKF